MDEISYALENNKKVIPVIIEQCEVPFRIKRLQYIDFAQDYDGGFKRLSSVLNLDKQDVQPAMSKPLQEKTFQANPVLKEPSLPKDVSSHRETIEEKKVFT